MHICLDKLGTLAYIWLQAHHLAFTEDTMNHCHQAWKEREMNAPAAALDIPTVAGRHRADMHRARLAGLHSHRQQAAREDLERTLRRRGLQVVADWHGGSGFALAVKCRLEHAREDREWIYAALDTCGWQPDRTRLSRINAKYDVLRLRHRDTTAPLMLVITNPACVEVVTWDAA